ncbi:MAG: hypothetical protein KDA47_10510, partial [Planctomycetales bacterium]|nr:hypothetical protein [Planctomycetales bacterium]
MTHTSKSLSQQVSELTTRLESLERRLGAAKISGGVSANSGELDRFCALPEVPERTFGRDVSPDRARLIQLLGKKWVNGTKLRYYFFDNGPFSAGNEQTDLVREGFDVWS